MKGTESGLPKTRAGQLRLGGSAIALGAAGWALVTMFGGPQATPPGPAPAPLGPITRVASPDAGSDRAAAPAPAVLPTPAPPVTPARLAATPPAPTAAAGQPFPYRYVGNTGAGADGEVVLFGRGRTVTLRGPGPIDDEYVVEHILDQGLQWRHLPSGTSQILRFALRQPAPQPAARAEDFPAD